MACLFRFPGGGPVATAGTIEREGGGGEGVPCHCWRGFSCALLSLNDIYFLSCPLCSFGKGRAKQCGGGGHHAGSYLPACPGPYLLSVLSVPSVRACTIDPITQAHLAHKVEVLRGLVEQILVPAAQKHQLARCCRSLQRNPTQPPQPP